MPVRRLDLLPARIVDAIYELVVSARQDGQAHPMDVDYERDLSGEIERDLDLLAGAIAEVLLEVAGMNAKPGAHREDS